MIFKPLPSQEHLRAEFSYEPETGVLMRRKSRNNKPLVPLKGKPDGYKVHRLIWMWMTGEDPGHLLVDHRDRNHLNNRWNNLRLSDYSGNGSNRVNNPDEFKGIRPSGKKWKTELFFKGVPYYLGVFPTEIEAALAYDRKARELYGEFACTNF
jgi:hypothetical protein